MAKLARTEDRKNLQHLWSHNLKTILNCTCSPTTHPHKLQIMESQHEFTTALPTPYHPTALTKATDVSQLTAEVHT